MQRVNRLIDRSQRTNELDLSYQDITVPNRIWNLTNLTYLNLSGNELTTLPQSIGNLTQLTRLELADNQLTTLPESIWNLIQLTSLELTNNELSTLPESITNLTRLEELHINANHLTSLPERIGNLTQLKKLKLGGNELTRLPESIGNLTQLTVLNLEFNELTTLPDSIGNLIQLKKLSLDNNQLTTLPDSIGNLIQLKKLYLGNNQLTTLPESIWNLIQLKRLDLNNNQLTTLSERIGNLTQLEMFDIRFNQLTTIPDSIRNLEHFSNFHFNNNNNRNNNNFNGIVNSNNNLNNHRNNYINNNNRNNYINNNRNNYINNNNNSNNNNNNNLNNNRNNYINRGDGVAMVIHHQFEKLHITDMMALLKTVVPQIRNFNISSNINPQIDRQELRSRVLQDMRAWLGDTKVTRTVNKRNGTVNIIEENTRLIDRFDDAFTKKVIEGYDRQGQFQLSIIKNVIIFVELQSPVFQREFATHVAMGCTQAYPYNPRMANNVTHTYSCPKGMVERFIMGLGETVKKEDVRAAENRPEMLRVFDRIEVLSGTKTLKEVITSMSQACYEKDFENYEDFVKCFTEEVNKHRNWLKNAYKVTDAAINKEVEELKTALQYGGRKHRKQRTHRSRKHRKQRTIHRSKKGKHHTQKGKRRVTRRHR